MKLKTTPATQGLASLNKEYKLKKNVCALQSTFGFCLFVVWRQKRANWPVVALRCNSVVELRITSEKKSLIIHLPALFVLIFC